MQLVEETGCADCGSGDQVIDHLCTTCRAKEARTCTGCGNEVESVDELADGLCEDCDQHYTWCNVCEKRLHEDEAQYRHRHVWWTPNGWVGPGGCDLDEHSLADSRAALHRLLDAVPMAEPLARTIQNDGMCFDTIHLSGSLFGYDSVWCYLYGEPDSTLRDGFKDIEFGDRITKAVKADDEEDEEDRSLSSAVMWLIGLDKRAKEANAQTLTWIAEWQAKQS